MVTIDVYRIILLISRLAPLFFLSLLICKTKSNSSSSSSFDTHKHKPTHTDAQNLQEHHHQNVDPTIHPTSSNHHHPTTTTTKTS